MTHVSSEESNLDKGYVFSVAIDLGTTHCGYAFSSKSLKEDVMGYSKWGECVFIRNCAKTTSVVLTDEDNNFEALGYEALEKYGDMTAKERREHRLYKEFKTALHALKELKETIEIEDVLGNKCEAMTVFVLAIKALKNNALSFIKESAKCYINEDHIRWVLAIPAIWNDAAKQFMKEAAVKADLVKSTEAQNLFLVLEPEATLTSCKKPRSSGDKILVIDVSGTSVHFTAYEVEEKGRLEELCVSTSLPLCTDDVNKDILKVVDDILKENFPSGYENPSNFENVHYFLEDKKRAFQPSSEYFKVELFKILSDKCRDHYGKELRKVVTAQYKEKKYFIKNGTLRIPSSLIMDAFSPVVDKIIEHIQSILEKEELQYTTHIFMTGGFSDSQVLRDAVNEKFGRRYNVVIPDESWSAIMRGAVWYGHSKKANRVRRTRMTYGIRADVLSEQDMPTREDADEKCHRKEYFFTLVEKGEKIARKVVFEKQVFPLFEDQKDMDIEILSTFDKTPRYVDVPGVSCVGQFDLNLLGEGTDRAVNVKMEFGETEILVEAKDTMDGGEVICRKLELLSL